MLPPPKRSAVIGRSLLISAASMFLVAFLIGRGTLALDAASRPVVTGALVAVGVLDLALGAFFLRRSQSS